MPRHLNRLTASQEPSQPPTLQQVISGVQERFTRIASPRLKCYCEATQVTSHCHCEDQSSVKTSMTSIVFIQTGLQNYRGK